MPEVAEPKIRKEEVEQPEVIYPWMVVLYNDNIHSFSEVIFQLQKATGCSVAEAEKIALKAHFEGKSVAFEGSFAQCFRVVIILREIELIVEIQG